MMVILQKKLVLTILAAVAAVGFFLGVFLQVSIYVLSSSARFEGVEFKISSSEGKRKSAGLGEDFMRERAADVERIRSFSPDKERPVEFIERLEGLARDTGNSIILDFDEGRSKGAELVFRVTVDGSGLSARKFLKLLELLPYQIGVQDLVFQQIISATGESESAISRQKRAVSTHRLVTTLAVKTF